MRRTGNRPVTLPTMDYDSFKKCLRAVGTQGPKMINEGVPVNGTRHLIANVPITLYNGLEIDGGKHGQVDGQTLINFGTTCHMDPDLQTMLYKDAGMTDEQAEQLIEATAAGYKEGRSGNTGINPENGKPFDTPAALDCFDDRSTNTVKIRPILDMQAIANANYDDAKAERLANPDRFKNVKEPSPEVERNLRNMMDVTVRFATTTNEIGSMNPDRAKENTARIAAQTALMTKGKGGSAVMFGKDEVAAVGQKINDTYAGYLKALADNPKAFEKGVPMVARDKKTGKPIPGKYSGYLPNTEVPDIKDLGLAVLEVDGATVFAVTSTDPNLNDARKKALPNINRGINGMMSQAFNSIEVQDDKDATIKNLGNRIDIQMYQATPQGVDNAFTLMSPSMQGTIRAYGNVVRDTIECAMHKHDGMDSKAAKEAEARGEQYLSKTIDDIYGKETLDNVRQIMADAGLETDPKALAASRSAEALEANKVSKQAFSDKCREVAEAQGLELVACEY